MARIIVLYESIDGHTRRVAQRIAEVLRGRGHVADIRDVATLLDTFSLRTFDGAIVGAPVRGRRLPRHLVRFCTENAAQLERMPVWMFTVGLLGSPEPALQALEAKSGWWPPRAQHFEGALRYTRYGRLRRFFMKRLAARAGYDTDTTRDHFYTDWVAVREFAKEFAAHFPPTAADESGEHPRVEREANVDERGVTWVDQQPGHA